mmetsp:Transcript_34749/g.94102  ORF Transcript_34749/g.94102 Transcript_34749/m.94102 type:complete len:91 (+) Transcript_34749:85-357(+)
MPIPLGLLLRLQELDRAWTAVENASMRACSAALLLLALDHFLLLLPAQNLGFPPQVFCAVQRPFGQAHLPLGTKGCFEGHDIALPMHRSF